MKGGTRSATHLLAGGSCERIRALPSNGLSGRVTRVNCLNCDALANDHYCARCGQKVLQTRPTIGHFLAEGLKSLTNTDSRLWQTLWYLIAKPGFLTQEYFAGRRVRYLPPIRLYLVLSVVFFFMLAVIPADENGSQELDWLEIEASCDEIEYHGPFGGYMKPKLEQACISAKQAGNGEAIVRTFLSNLPKAMWFSLPIYAFFMMAFWWRPQRLYAEHLLFLINNHSAMFALLTLDSMTVVIPDIVAGWVSIAVFIYLFWYNWRALYVFYGDSKPIAIFKFLVLLFLYVILGAVVLFLTGFLSVLNV